MTELSGSERAEALRLATHAFGVHQRVFGWLTSLGCLTFLALVTAGVVGLVEAAHDAGSTPLAGGLLALAAVLITCQVRWVRRCRTWLAGTQLVARGPFGTTRCDLATASVTIDSRPERKTVPVYGSAGMSAASVPTGRRLPRLVVRDAATGKVLHLALRSVRGELIPPSQLAALASAIAAGPRRNPVEDRQAQLIADGLRRLAADPFAGHS